jgi:hypothetical protein
MKRPLAALLLAVSCWASAASAATPTPPQRSVYKPALILQWKDRLHVANESLQAGEWKKGFEVADAVLREMRDRIASGESSGALLAVALLFRSIGEAGLQRNRDAAWDFGTAQAFYPEYSKVDLKPYGAAGAALEPWRYANGAPSDPSKGALPRDQDHPGLTPPRKIAGARPEYPLAKAKSCIEHPIVVQTIINESGETEFPSIEPGTDPVLALAAFDAIRKWRFEPASRDAKPVRVYFLLAVNFHVRGCA